jgi:indole-3-glycerol phosphate synthase
MKDILSKICENKKIELEKTKQRCSFSSLEKILQNKNNRNFKKLIINSQDKKNNNIIAEIKKASPSAGIIIKDYFPEIIAADYEKSGVGAISILTETNFFYGNLDHLSLINKKTNLPLLRKDFIIDPYQILESKVYQADAILLIVSILSDNQMKDFINLAKQYKLDCLIEAHTEEDLNRAINIGYPVIGINNRNLKNFSVNINNTLNLIKKIPKEFIVVAESGIKSKTDIDKYNDIGVFNFLIGESILKSTNINDKIREFLN